MSRGKHLSLEEARQDKLPPGQAGAIKILADLIDDQFGRAEGGLAGVPRLLAEHLSKRWLERLELDGFSLTQSKKP